MSESFYVFTRNKRSGNKKVIKTVATVEEARDICNSMNKASSRIWHEFTSDIEYTKN